MSYPDFMDFRSGPYAPDLRDLNDDENELINQLVVGIQLLIVHRAQMAALPDTGTEYGPRYCDDAYASMITDMRCEIAEIEKRPQAELDNAADDLADWRYQCARDREIDNADFREIAP